MNAHSPLKRYQAQVQLLCNLLKPQHVGIEIGTVDGMQGREQEVVILSLVRSNNKVCHMGRYFAVTSTQKPY